MRKIMVRVCEHAEIAHRTPYDLRHTFATLLLSGQAAGLSGHPAPLTYVAAQLGHAKPTTTLAWYAHWIPSDSSVRYVDALDSAAKASEPVQSTGVLAPLWHHSAQGPYTARINGKSTNFSATSDAHPYPRVRKDFGMLGDGTTVDRLTPSM